MRTSYRTPPGWQRTVSRHGGCVFSHQGKGLAVMKPGLSRHWFVFRSDGSKDPQPYRTWIDAVRDAGDQP